MRKTQNSAAEYAATITPLTELRHNMDSEMRKCFVGPTPVRVFLQKFLPVTPPPMPKNESSGFEVMTGSEVEKQVYKEFVTFFSVIVWTRHL